MPVSKSSINPGSPLSEPYGTGRGNFTNAVRKFLFFHVAGGGYSYERRSRKKGMGDNEDFHKSS